MVGMAYCDVPSWALTLVVSPHDESSLTSYTQRPTHTLLKSDRGHFPSAPSERRSHKLTQYDAHFTLALNGLYRLCTFTSHRLWESEIDARRKR